MVTYVGTAEIFVPVYTTVVSSPTTSVYVSSLSAGYANVGNVVQGLKESIFGPVQSSTLVLGCCEAGEMHVTVLLIVNVSITALTVIVPK